MIFLAMAAVRFSVGIIDDRRKTPQLY